MPSMMSSIAKGINFTVKALPTTISLLMSLDDVRYLVLSVLLSVFPLV